MTCGLEGRCSIQAELRTLHIFLFEFIFSMFPDSISISGVNVFHNQVRNGFVCINVYKKK